MRNSRCARFISSSALMFSLCLQRNFSTCLLTGFDYGDIQSVCTRECWPVADIFKKNTWNVKNLQYNVHVILAGIYIEKKVYLKSTNRASIKEITDFGMILRPYKLFVIAKVQWRWYTSECPSVCGSGLNIWVKPEPHIWSAYIGPEPHIRSAYIGPQCLGIWSSWSTTINT